MTVVSVITERNFAEMYIYIVADGCTTPMKECSLPIRNTRDQIDHIRDDTIQTVQKPCTQAESRSVFSRIAQ